MYFLNVLAAAYAIWLALFVLRPSSTFWQDRAGAVSNAVTALALLWLSIVALVPHVAG